jgi:hypothetical protein
VVDKINQLEEQYFKENKGRDNRNEMQEEENVFNSFDPINRVDVERYEEEKKPIRGKQK